MDDAEKVLTDIRTRATSEQGKIKSALRAGDAYKLRRTGEPEHSRQPQAEPHRIGCTMEGFTLVVRY